MTTESRFRWTRKHLLGLEDLSPEEIYFALDTAASFKEVSTRSVKKVPALRGRVVVNAFFEASTRTRTSFELAAQRLSADVIDFSEKGSSVSKGETLIDTARTIEAMGIDVIVIRHGAAGSAELLSRSVQVQHRQRRRRRARAPDAGPARPLHHPRAVSAKWTA
jgi:aspartate carbamoyltransferase catalytic subunit